MERKVFKSKVEFKQEENIGRIKFYFLIFDYPDAYGDTFDKNLEVLFDDRVRWFLNHDENTLLGAIIEINKDESGWYAVCEMPMVGKMQEVYALYTLGAISEHSMGFESVEYVTNEIGGRHFTKIRLWEVSTITHWAAQPLAKTIEVREEDVNFAKKEPMNTLKEDLETKASAQEMQIVQAAVSGINAAVEKMTVIAQALSESTASLQNINQQLGTIQQDQSPLVAEEMRAIREAFERKESKINFQLKNPLIRKNFTLSRPGQFTYTPPGIGVPWNAYISAGGLSPNLSDYFRVVPIESTTITYLDVDPGSFTLDPTALANLCDPARVANFATTIRTQSLFAYRQVTNICSVQLLDYNEAEVIARDLLRNLVLSGIERDIATVLLGSPAFNAIAYASSVPNANLFDLLSLMIGDVISTSDGMWKPDLVIMHPQTYNLLILSKDGNGQYLQIPTFSYLSNVDIITSSAIPNLSVIVGVSDTLRIYSIEGRGIDVQSSFENKDNFEKDIMTLRAQMYAYPLRRLADIGAWRVSANWVNDVTTIKV